MIVDFRRTRNMSNSISIIGEEMEVVEEYKYLSVHLSVRLDSRMVWGSNTNAVYKREQCYKTS